ncbi:replication protein RepA [Glutamicibacter arilaitensis]
MENGGSLSENLNLKKMIPEVVAHFEDQLPNVKPDQDISERRSIIMLRDNSTHNHNSDQSSDLEELAFEVVEKSQAGSKGKVSPQLKKLFDASDSIRNEEPDELWFAPDFMIQTSLPASKPKGSVYTRKNGKMTLVIKPASIFDDKGNLEEVFPYGIYPRIVLIWIVTEAVRTKSRFIDLGPSLNHFMTKKLGLSSGGAQRIQGIRKQILALLGAPISALDSSAKSGFTNDRARNLFVSTNYDLWTQNRADAKSDAKQSSWLELSQEFYSYLNIDDVGPGPAPLDMRAVQGLGKDVLALDIYSWVVWRVFAAKGRDTKAIRWATLQKQFGSEHKKTPEFKRDFMEALKKVRLLYPGLKFEVTPSTFKLLASELAIEPRARKRLYGKLS